MSSRAAGPPSAEASAIGARGQSGHPTKRRAEGARIVVSDAKSNVRHRGCVLCQQCLGALDALRQLVALGRHTEGLTKGPAEIAGAQTNELRQRAERYGLRKTRLDIGDRLSPLPCGEAPGDSGQRAVSRVIHSRELMHQHDSQSFGVTMIRATAFDQCRKLQRSLDQCTILEE